MNNNIREYDDEPDGLYDDTALRREDEAEAYKQDNLRELEKQLDAQLEQIRVSKDARTLKEWTADELAKTLFIPTALATEIVADEAREWEIAKIPFDWNRPINKASHKMRLQALYSTQEQYQKWRKAHG